MTTPTTPPPGWYPNHQGQTQWWDGGRWGQLAPPQSGVVRYAPQYADATSGTVVVVQSPKEVGIAYLFALLLGGFAAHRFYLRRTGSAIGFLILWWAGWLSSWLLIGIPLIIAGAIWLIVDLFLIPGMVREENTRFAPPTTYALPPTPPPPAIRG